MTDVSVATGEEITQETEEKKPSFDLPEEVESLEEIPVRARQFYDPKEGGGFELAEIAPLKNALKNAKAERQQLRTKANQIKAYESLGKTPDEIQEILDRERAQEERKALEKGEFEKVKTQISEAHQAELKALKKERDDIRQTMYRDKMETGALKAINRHSGLVKPLIRELMAVSDPVDVDGKVEVRISDGRGGWLLSKREDAGDYMTQDEYVETLKPDSEWEHCFKASGANGSGAQPVGSAGGAGGKKRSEMNDDQKAAFIEDHGEEKYLALPF